MMLRSFKVHTLIYKMKKESEEWDFCAQEMADTLNKDIEEGELEYTAEEVMSALRPKPRGDKSV